MKAALFVCTLVSLIVFLAICGHCQTNPLPLGLVEDTSPVTCPAGFPSSSTCQALTISCANVANQAVILGTELGTNGKTIFLMNGSTWTVPGMQSYVKPFHQAGYNVVVATVPSWQYAGAEYTPSILAAACRPATLIHYVANGSQVALGAASAGSAAAAYALAWYGEASDVAVVEIGSGPVMSDLSQGCETPKAPDVTVIPTNGVAFTSTVYYNAGIPSQMSEFTGETCLSKQNSTPAEIQGWLDQSILAPGAQLSYPTTQISAWLCATSQEPNNSAGQGWLWLSQVSATQITAMTGCSGSEDIDNALTPQGVTGLDALVADLEARF
jgi:hypothetical protein